MSEKLSKEQIRQLAAPFSLPEHEFREGGRGEYLVYITELPLITRLNDVDPAWELSIKETIILEQPDAPAVVNVFGELTICGVSRANVGTYAAKLQTTEYDPVKKQRVRLDPPRVLPLDDNATKAAATDLLKRCARSFGCGGYLLAAPRLKADSEDAAQTMFARWYKQAFPVADQSRRIQTGPVQAPPEPPDDEQQVQQAFTDITWTRDNARVAKMLNAAEQMWAISRPHAINRVAKALGLDNPQGKYETLFACIATYGGSPQDAWAALSAYESDKDATTCYWCDERPATGDGPYPELCATCARSKADDEAAKSK